MNAPNAMRGAGKGGYARESYSAAMTALLLLSSLVRHSVRIGSLE